MPPFLRLNRWLVVPAMLWLAVATAQTTVLRGIVTDAQGDPLPFVSVIINDTPGQGVLTDIEGRFSIDEQRAGGTGPVRSLSFRYVGYRPLRLEGAALRPAGGRALRVVLEAADYDLPEALIVAGENPADILIRRAIARRQENNPENRRDYRCRTYNKIVFETVPHRAAFEAWESKRDTATRRMRNLRRNFAELERRSAERELFVIESVTERSFLKPDQLQERVLLNRVSGFQQAGLIALANAIQPFSFYGDYLTILDKNFVNPISPGSPDLYFFQLEDTLYTGPDTVYVISFHPRQGRVFEGLQGVLQLHSDGWAVQNVRARPALPGENADMRIEQGYVRAYDTLTGEQQWFPQQLNFELEFLRYPAEYTGMRISGRSYISDVELKPGLRLRDFNRETPLFIEPGAHTRADTAWAPYRTRAPLTSQEERTYQWLDSLGDMRNYDRVSRMLDIAATGLWPVAGDVSLDLRRLIRLNDFERVRLGVGLTTAQWRPLHLPKRFEAGAYAGYGLRDRTVKYGGFALWRLARRSATQLRIEARHDLQEPGTLYELPPAAFVNRSLYARRMDVADEYSATLGSRLWKGASGQVSVRRQWLDPAYDYAYGPPDAPPRTTFRFTEATLFARYAYGEQVRTLLGGTLSRINKVPVIELAYTRGVYRGAADRPYQRWAAALYQSVGVRRLGRTTWRLEAGQVTSDVPLARLFTLNQPGTGGWNLFVIANTFQSLPDTLFAADRFVNFYFTQEIGPVLYQRKYSAPILSLRQHLAYGELRRPDLHRIGLRAANPPLLESGVQLDNLVRFNYGNFAYLGLGGAVFYRYGGLAAEELRKNFVYRLTMRLSL